MVFRLAVLDTKINNDVYIYVSYMYIKPNIFLHMSKYVHVHLGVCDTSPIDLNFILMNE